MICSLKVHPLVIGETGKQSRSSAVLCPRYRAGRGHSRLTQSALPKRKLAEEQIDNRAHRFA